MDNPTEKSVARLDVPRSGGGCGVIFLVVFVGFFVALAIHHLTHFSETHPAGLVCAVLWLLLVAVCTLGGVQAAGGIRASMVATLGAFASREFVEVMRDGDRVTFCFGFELFRRRLYYFSVAREHVVSVEMGTGQATTLAGRDMNDWQVVVWYRDPAKEILEWKRKFGVREEEVYVVGPPQAKTVTSEFFAQFLAFLRSVGVDLHPGAKENEFRVPVA